MSGDLFNKAGKRLYLTLEERKRFLKAAEAEDRKTRTFCAVLATRGSNQTAGQRGSFAALFHAPCTDAVEQASRAGILTAASLMVGAPAAADAPEGA